MDLDLMLGLSDLVCYGVCLFQDLVSVTLSVSTHLPFILSMHYSLVDLLLFYLTHALKSKLNLIFEYLFQSYHFKVGTNNSYLKEKIELAVANC